MENTQVKAMSKSQLAHAYAVSLKTFNKWIQPFQEQIGQYKGRAYTPKQVKTIYELLGSPA